MLPLHLSSSVILYWLVASITFTVNVIVENCSSGMILCWLVTYITFLKIAVLKEKLICVGINKHGNIINLFIKKYSCINVGKIQL